MASGEKYILKRGKWYHYVRRRPEMFTDIFPGKYIRTSLKTDSESLALIRAGQLTQFLDDYFETRSRSDKKVDNSEFKLAMTKLKMCGFRYKPFAEIVTEASPQDFINRINTAAAARDIHTKRAITGIIQKPKVKISDLPGILFEYEKLTLSRKNDNELRKYKTPVIKAVNNFINVCGDMAVADLQREDILEFRQWWIDRIIEEDLSENSANKDLGKLRKAVRIASDNNSLALPVLDLFSNTRLSMEGKKERPSFSREHIRDVLLGHEYKTVSPECRYLVYIMADTGARIKEIVGLMDDDINLQADIPHIHIRPNSIRQLKTKPSVRTIPLVGSALQAFREMNGPFKDYLGRSDRISATTNKYLSENGLYPTPDHTLYSLRHSFEDRLTAVEPPEKIQAILMGHKYNREKYGEGATLDQKLKWLNKIVL